MTDAETLPTTEAKQGWRKLLLAMFLFVFAPNLPHFGALLPVDETMLLFVPAMAACALVGWWAGGRMLSAVLWVGVAIVIGAQPQGGTEFGTLLRGWSLILAGAFGVACLLGPTRAFFPKALASVCVALVVGLIMAQLGTAALSSNVVLDEFGRRNADVVADVSKAITANAAQWDAWSSRVPALATFPDDLAVQLAAVSRVGMMMFPALLALESLAALALAWATYHRLSRRRVGAPLSPLREFRFNDQYVWGLIVGLVILLLPNLASLRGLGANLVLFFGALYAIRGLGVLAWFMAPGRFATVLVVGFVLVFVPVVSVVAILGFMTLGITALGLGVGDTWADWRSRPRSTLS